MPKQDDRPRAFTMRDRNGKTEFLDWYSGMVIEGYVGLYVCWTQAGDQWLMRTWIDRGSGERAFAAVRRWEGYREEIFRG